MPSRSSIVGVLGGGALLLLGFMAGVEEEEGGGSTSVLRPRSTWASARKLLAMACCIRTMVTGAH